MIQSNKKGEKAHTKGRRLSGQNETIWKNKGESE